MCFKATKFVIIVTEQQNLGCPIQGPAMSASHYSLTLTACSTTAPAQSAVPSSSPASVASSGSIKHLSLGPSPPWLRPNALITCPSEPRPQGAQGTAGPLWLPIPGWPSTGHLPGSFFISLRPSGCDLALALHKLRADSLDPSPLDLLEASSASLFFLFYAAAISSVTLGE